MRHSERLELEDTAFQHLVSIDVELDQLDLFGQTGFLELFPDQSAGEPGGIDRRLDLLQQISQRADMVFMTVGDEDAAQLRSVLFHIVEVGQDEVDSVVLDGRESDTAIDHDKVVLMFEIGRAHV